MAAVSSVSLIAKHGKIDVECVGHARDTIFRISSMTKPVTGLATMLLVEDGKLRLDEPVERLLPELANRRVLTRIDAELDETVPAKRSILVRDLLDFTMGMGLVFAQPGTHPIQRALDDAKLGQGMPAPRTPPPPDEWMRRLGELPLMHQPGERWMYNTGSDVLGVLIARASGKTFDAFLQERIFEPLGMKDTGFFVPESKLHRLPTSRLADGTVYDEPDGQWSAPPAFPSGAAGLVSTADDFHAFGAMMLRRGKPLLSEASIDAMTNGRVAMDFSKTARWGFCMEVVTDAEDESGSVGAFGWDGGMGTSWRTDPKEDAVRIFMTQRTWSSPSPPDECRAFWRAARA